MFGRKAIMIFENLIKDWLDNGLQRYTIRTQMDYKKISKYYKEFHSLNITDIDDRILLRFFIELSKGRRYKTVRNILSCLSSFYDYCVCKGYVDNNPCVSHTLITRLRSSFRAASDKIRIQKYAITTEDALKLLEGAYLISFEFGLGTEFLICSGIRLGELAALRKIEISNLVPINKNVNEITKEIQYSCKWGSNGVAEIPKTLLQKYKIFANTNTSEWAFPYIRFFSKQFSKRLGLLSKRLGIKHTTAHTLRRTALTWLASDGYSISVIQRIARHSTIRMTEHYIDKNQISITGVTESISARINKHK